MAQDFRYTDGARVGMTVNGGGNEGDAVKVTGDLTVSTVTTAGDDHDGVLTADADDGEKVVIALSGVIEATVATGTGSGSYLTPDGTGGFRGINTGGATGETAGPTRTLALTSESDGKAYVRLP